MPNKEKTNIDIIIPSKSPIYEVVNSLKAISKQTILPNKVIIVNSFDSIEEDSKDLKDIVKNKFQLIIINCKNTFPGHARNIGLENVTSNYVAFLDIKTLPHENWLKTNLFLLQQQQKDICWGRTVFMAKTKFQKVFVDTFFGRLPSKTLPGSLMTLNAIKSSGIFLSWVRAAEDTEWINRVSLLRLKTTFPEKETISYTGFTKFRLQDFINRWRRNYLSARVLPHFDKEKNFVFKTILFLAIVIVALNWNPFLAGWNQESLLYISHVTKFVVAFPILVYLFYRGIFLPFKRKVPVSSIFPIRFIFIILVGLIGDFIKVTTLYIPHRVRKNKVK